MKSKPFLLLAAIALAGTAYADETHDAQATVAAAAPAEPVSLEWSWDEPRRIFVEAEVHLPYPMWFMAEHNKEQRAIAYQVRTVLDCAEAVAERRRLSQVSCRIEDIGISAAGLPGKEGLLDPIVKEFDERLTGATLQLQIRSDGRLTNVDIEGLERPRRRSGEINETLRLVMSRTVAGLDLQVPRDPVTAGAVWPQYHTWLMAAPASTGSSGSVEMLHKVEAIHQDGRFIVASVAQGLIVPGGEANKYQTRLTSWSVFDPDAGFLTERAWNAQGLPTASSGAAEGLAGLPYDQIGQLKLIGDDEKIDVGESGEVAPPGATPTTLQLWPPLGATRK